MKFKAKKKSLLFILGFIISLTITNSINFSTWQKSIVNNPKVSAGYNLSFIHIDGSISDNWTLTALQPWCNYDSDSGYYIIENVTIDASGSPASCGILINNSLDYNFIIRNCSVTYGTGGSGALSSVGGIKIVNSSRGILFNNTCSNGINWGSGILLYNEVHNITIERNEIYNNYNGIRVESSSYNITIKNNTINNNQYRGIWLINGVHNTTIINNNVNDNQFLSGIELRVNCDYNKIINNNGSLTNIYYASQDNGIYLIDGCDDNFIFNNSLNNNDNYGIQIELNCNNNTVLNNTASNLNGGTNQNRGIYLHSNSHYNNITGNIVNNNDQYGIYLSSCEHNSITGNIFYSTGDYGLGLEYCDYNNITGNTAKFNIEGGIYLSDSDWNNISKNFVNDNTQIGIFLRKSSWGSNNNTISNNTINRNDVGIVVYSSNDNNITENILKDNNLCISELYCQGNLIINNDCTTPTVQEPIFINGTATGFGAHNWTWVEQQSWFGGGLGTENVPYIIENLKITGYGIDLINGIEIVNSNVFFIIRGCIIYNSVNGISLKNVNNSQLINNTCSYNIEAGIYLEENSYFNNISENILNDNDYGIYLVNNCGNNTITENKLNSMIFDGIYLDNNCNYTTITGNTLNNNEKGIYLTSCGYNNITGNTATDNTYNGIHLESFNDYNIIIGNNFDGNDIGIELNEESDFNIVIENTVNNNEGGIGIIIENCIENDISGNSANNNSYGIYIYENSNNNSISGNTANDNSVEGIYLYGYCINNSISGNTLNNNYRGIRIHSNSEFNNVSGNTINYNDYGIFLSTYTNNNTISNNKMNCKNKGIELDNGCQDNTISGNIIRNCTEEGVILKEGCDNNEFVDNIIYNNSLGIDVSDSDDNWFYRNFFVNNIKHAVDDGSDNMWNSTTIGNYWDNLTGPDANSDGIVDSEYRPYNISGSAQSKDYFPIADDEFPTITINTPTSGNIFGSMAPSFNVRITDVYLYEMWYTINGGLNNYTFTDNGTINQDAWDAIAEGNVTLTFYASDKPMHTNSEEIVIVKDNENPSIYINSPSSGEVFDNNAPFFNVRITEDYLVSMWYTIDGGLNNYTFTTNSTINQTRWDAMTDGTITLRFYAIDDLGHVGTAEVSIIKDTIAPIIIINAPTDGETFGNTAPLFNITIIEANLDEIWYSIDGGLTNYTILNNGTFDQTAWTALSEGEVNITFYVKDLAGHEVSESVAVIKSIPDGGLDPTIIIIIVVSIVVGVAVISVVYIFVKKRGST